MPKLKVLPHAALCPQGAEIEAPSGKSICDALLESHIDIEHACEKSCACTTCHVVVRKGYESLGDAEEKEEDLLDTIEIPKYTINYEREGGAKK
jgi:2Fe-2S ferredoxin